MIESIAYDAFKAELLLSKITPKEQLLILDIGCGDGTIAHFIANQLDSAHVIGLDFNEELIEEAKNSYTNAHFIVNSPDQLPFEAATFDILYFSESLHHMAHSTRIKILQEAQRVLKPAGILIFLELNPWHRATRSTFYKNPEEEGLHMLSPFQLIHYCLKSNFTFLSLTFANPSSSKPYWWPFQPIFLLIARLK